LELIESYGQECKTTQLHLWGIVRAHLQIMEAIKNRTQNAGKLLKYTMDVEFSRRDFHTHMQVWQETTHAPEITVRGDVENKKNINYNLGNKNSSELNMQN
jgi:hypothetical protein